VLRRDNGRFYKQLFFVTSILRDFYWTFLLSSFVVQDYFIICWGDLSIFHLQYFLLRDNLHMPYENIYIQKVAEHQSIWSDEAKMFAQKGKWRELCSQMNNEK